MAEPKKRMTSTRSGNRTRHQYLRRGASRVCQHCHQLTVPHQVCRNCGYYKGAEVIDVLKKLTKKEKKQKEREMKAKEETEKKATQKEGGLSWEGLSKK